MKRTILESLHNKWENYISTGSVYIFHKNYTVNEDALSSIARSRTTNLLIGYVVGQKELYEPFVAETKAWGIKALPKEDHVASRSFLCQAIALLDWLEHDQDDTQLWQNTVTAYNLWFFEAENPTDYSASKGIEVDLFCKYLQACLFAKDYERGISVYEHYKGDKLKLTARSGKLALLYAYLRHFAYDEFSLEQLEKTAKNTLPKFLKQFYGRGYPEEGTMWLKTVCNARIKAGQFYTAEQIILTFYEYLTDEEKPDFVHELLAARM